jgi:hypothetical protein
MQTEFPREPLCEICEREPADQFIYFHVPPRREPDLEPAREEKEQLEAEGDEPKDPNAAKKKGWRFCGACMNDEGTYPIEVDRFFHSAPATVDWIAHLHEKNWMDWRDFADMMDRFRESTQSYGQCTGYP